MKKNILDKLAYKEDVNLNKKRGLNSTKLTACLFIIPSLIFLFLVHWRPIVIGIYYSFFKLKGYTPVEFVGFDNYIKVLRDTHFFDALLNTLQYVAWEALLGFFPPVLVAIMLNEVRRGHKMLKFAIYFPTIVPGIVTALMWRMIYEPDATGLLNNILSRIGIEPMQFLNSPYQVIFWICVSIAWNSLGGNMIYYLAGLKGISGEIYEAAAIDGAGLFKRARYITLPQISGIILLFVIRMVINVFQTMERPLTMTNGGPNGASLSLGLLSYRYAFEQFRTEYALALGVIQFLILIGITAFYFILQKKIDTQ